MYTHTGLGLTKLLSDRIVILFCGNLLFCVHYAGHIHVKENCIYLRHTVVGKVNSFIVQCSAYVCRLIAKPSSGQLKIYKKTNQSQCIQIYVIGEVLFVTLKLEQ